MRKINRFISLLVCILFVCILPMMVSAQEDSDIIRISTKEEFIQFAEACRLDSFSANKHFLLTADIDLTGTDFDGVPIFCGTFDGGFHTISGLEIHSAGSAKGLFRYVTTGATVKNIHVKGEVIPKESRSNVGGIVGNNAGIILDCTFTGTIAGAEKVGGIAGLNQPGGLIADCHTDGSISAFHFVGGVVGFNQGTIRNCTNLCGVNITAQQNQINIGDITLGNLTNTESLTATTDIGGIAGYSNGTILGCTNRGSVGYAHMGYNVGGIAGLQVGYIADCENYGSISGRKEVGGIVGQQEPEVLIRYDTDTVQILKGQMDVLSDLIDRTAANANTNSSKIRNLLYKLETHIADAEKALDYLKAGLHDPKLEDLKSYADAIKTIRDSINGIETTLGNLWDAMDDSMTDLEKDLDALSQQIAVIEATLNHAEDHLGGMVFDSSDEDTDEMLTSKIVNSRNFGSVQADMNAGGIVGAVIFENDLDLEEDISVVGDVTLNAVGSIRSVVKNCANTGSVLAKNDRIGGIVGRLSIGLVKDCVNTGNLQNPSADYVGGIAGESTGFIRNCRVKAVICGNSYVGGIAGSGCIVSDCFAMIQLTGEEMLGCILGFAIEPHTNTELPINHNYYLQFGRDYGAIDGISYDQIAQGLNQDDFFMLSQDPLFDQVTITFIANGEVVMQTVQRAGSAFTEMPEVPEQTGYTGFWSDLDSIDWNCILFDLNIQAEYVTYSSVIQSDRIDEKGRPVLLFQGDFAISATAAVTPLQNVTALQRDQRLISAWQISLERCLDLQKGRLLIPSGEDLKNVILLVKDINGNWSERVYNTNDSYIVFSLANGDQAVALVETQGQSLLSAEQMISAAVGASLVIVIAGAVAIIIRLRRKKKASITE